MMFTALTSYLVFDLSTSIKDVIGNYFLDMTGNIDLSITSETNLDDEFFAKYPETSRLTLYDHRYEIAYRDPEQYGYEFTKDLRIIGLNLKTAYEMELLPELNLNDSEAAVAAAYAEEYGIHENDTISLYDVNGNTHDYTVAKILTGTNGMIPKDSFVVIVPEETMTTLLDTKELNTREFMIDVKDDAKVEEFCKAMEEIPSIEYVRLKGNEQIQSMIMQVTSIFLVLFLVTFLMVLFITVNISERIVIERMFTIGTFKSLGISGTLTTMILLLENAFYAILGFIPGTGLYLLIRPSLLSGMISTSSGDAARIDPIHLYIYIFVLLLVLGMQFAAPALELMKAVKTPIRDIIFSNQDTEYRLSKFRTTLGGVLVIIATVLYVIFGKSNGLMIFGSLILGVVGISLMIPLFLRLLSMLLSGLFQKAGMPVATYASTELGSKKTDIVSGVLCVSICALCIAVFGIAGGMMNFYTRDTFDSDVTVGYASQKETYYHYIEDLPGVTDVQYIYTFSDEMTINEQIGKRFYGVMAYTKPFLITGIKNLPEELGFDEFAISQTEANKLGMKVGETYHLSFASDSVFPTERDMTLKAIAYTSEYTASPIIILNAEQYEKIYHDTVSEICIKCSDPDTVRDTIKKYSVEQNIKVRTKAEIAASDLKESQGVRLILYCIIGLGVILTIIGISGNQMIGFEGRKREYAVMHSTSMSKGQIGRVILLETFFVIGSSITIALLLGRLILFMIERALYALDIPLPLDSPFSSFLMMGGILFLLIMFTTVFPMRAVRKMNTAETLKYE
ncbi:MAG: FtsX-like permease family protein [Lachnospiraceae bacterium]|nr:FtsX-like permease family protein [Lachnospiraceae bacterium]